MKTLMRFLMALAMVSLIAACGGGGGCAGTPTNGTNTCTASTSATTTTTGTPAVAKFVYTLDKVTINDGGTDAATLTITALDASNNVVPGAAIAVTVSSGTWAFANGNKADANGNVVGKVTAAGDKSNRTITVNFTDGNGTVGTAAVLVTGAALTLTVTPTIVNTGQAVTVAVKAADVNNNGAAGVAVQLSLSGGTYSGTLTTNASGQASVSVNAPATAGTYTWTASALGVTQTSTMQVGATAAIPNVTATIASANLAINPVAIAPNTAGSTASQAQLRALFTDNVNQPVANVRVRFELDPTGVTPPPFSTGETISTGVNTVYSDATGVALSAYVAGQIPTATDGVRIRACYGPTDASIAGTLCPNQVKATLTVASAPVSITIGSNNLLAKDSTGTIYTQTLVVVVNDTAGVAVSGANVSGSVDITHYGKGYSYADPYYINSMSQVLLTAPVYGQSGVNAADTPTAGNYTANPVVPGKRVWCANEDYNRNGTLDTTLTPPPPISQYPLGSEDVNQDKLMEPHKADVTIAFPNGHLTDVNGQLIIKVSWLMNVATWEAYTVTASTSVSGTQGIVKQAFQTTFVQGDEKNGSFLTPPYGVGRCQDAF